MSDETPARLAAAPGPAEPLDRPGPLLRAAAGAWHVPAGFMFLLRNPSFWGLASLPAMLAVVLTVGGGIAGYLLFPSLEARFAPSWERIPDVLRFLMTLALWAATVAAGMAAGFALAVLLSAPVLERLSRQVEARVRGAAADAAQGLGWEIAQSLRGAAYFVAAMPGVFLLSVVPVVGPPLAALWAAYALAFQQTDAPLTRRGLDFAAKRAWHRRWRAEGLGFGLAGLIALLVPLANVLLAPALATGATLMVLELEDAWPAAPAAQPTPPEPVAAG